MAMMIHIFQTVERVRMESGPAPAVLPLVGLAAGNITRDRYIWAFTDRLFPSLAGR